MKKIIISVVSLFIICIIGYKVYEVNVKSTENAQTSISSSIDNAGENNSSSSNSDNISETDESDYSDKSILNETAKEENQKIDRSNTIDVNKVEDIIREKFPKGSIKNIEFKNDSDNPHYDVEVISENYKYELEISLKDGAVKELEKEKLN